MLVPPSKDAKETGSSPTGGSLGQSGGRSSSPEEKSKDGASPKIQDKDVPGGNKESKEAEVQQHNKEFEEGHDRAPPAEEDKVDKKFWKGEFYRSSSLGMNTNSTLGKGGSSDHE